MADNRQFTDHNEIGGVNVYLEDKKLAESPEQNTVASTDYVLLKDEDNIPRKISKANLMSVVKDAIGELLKSNDLGTSVTNVPALNASAFGSATVADLASVLGGLGSEMSEIQSGDTIQIITPQTYGEVWLVDARDKSTDSNGVATFIMINSRYNGHRITYFLCKTEQAGLTAVETQQGSVILTSTAGGAIVVRKIKLMEKMS